MPLTDEPWAENLTEREAQAVREYLIDGSEVAAYTRAGYGGHHAHKNANRFFQQDHIRKAVADVHEGRCVRTGIDADWLLTRLAAEVDADVAELYDEDGFLKHVKDWPRVWRTGLVAGMDIEEIKTRDGIVGRLVKVKLADRTKRLEMIGKHVAVQAWRERIEHGLTREAAELITAGMTAKEAADAYREEMERGN